MKEILDPPGTSSLRGTRGHCIPIPIDKHLPFSHTKAVTTREAQSSVFVGFWELSLLSISTRTLSFILNLRMWWVKNSKLSSARNLCLPPLKSCRSALQTLNAFWDFLKRSTRPSWSFSRVKLEQNWTNNIQHNFAKRHRGKTILWLRCYWVFVDLDLFPSSAIYISCDLVQAILLGFDFSSSVWA